jgi:hypothetical protein
MMIEFGMRVVYIEEKGVVETVVAPNQSIHSLFMTTFLARGLSVVYQLLVW